MGSAGRRIVVTGPNDPVRRYDHGVPPRAGRRCRALALVAIVALLTGASTTGAHAQPSTPTADGQIDIGTPATSVVWLCRPGLADDPCGSDLTTTKRPPIDCFYLYPTVSGQATTNADLSLDPEIRAVAETQASRFSQDCSVFAPIYPQITVAGLGRPAELRAAGAIAYAGVVDAWRDYLEHDNHGRGFVLVGDSEGATLLRALLVHEIEHDANVRDRIVSAILAGTNIGVPIGKDVGGTFAHVRACRSRRQTGCAVSDASFDEVPPRSARFGNLVDLVRSQSAAYRRAHRVRGG